MMITSKYKNFIATFEPQPLRVQGNRIYVTDFIDADFGTSADAILEALGGFEDGDEVEIVLNSPGGSVSEGISIYNILKDRPNTNTLVSGMTASIASVIAMAGNKVAMYDNALMMIHKPSSIVYGDANALLKEAEILDKVENDMLIPSYSRTGIEADKLRQMLADETWLGAKEAKQKRFVDAIIDRTPKKEGPLDEQKVTHRLAKHFTNNMKRIEELRKLISKTDDSKPTKD